MPHSAIKSYQNRFVGDARAMQVEHHRTRLTMPLMHDGNITIARVQGACFHAIENNQHYFHTPDVLITRNAGDSFEIESDDSIYQSDSNFRAIFIDTHTINQIKESGFASHKNQLAFLSAIHEHPPMLALFERIHPVMIQSNDMMEAESALLQFTASLFTYFGSAPTAHQRIPDSASISKARAFIAEYYDEKLTLQEIANASNMNPFTLIRAFKRHTGMTPFQFLTSERVARSKQLLAKGLELAEVSAMVGFYDQSHFYKKFRQFSQGHTPGEFVASLR